MFNQLISCIIFFKKTHEDICGDQKKYTKSNPRFVENRCIDSETCTCNIIDEHVKILNSMKIQPVF